MTQSRKDKAASVFVSAQMRGHPGHQPDVDSDDDEEHVVQMSGCDVPLNATRPSLDFQAKFSYKGTPADPWQTTSGSAHSAPDVPPELLQPENARAAPVGAVNYVDKTMAGGQRLPLAGERLTMGNRRSTVQDDFTWKASSETLKAQEALRQAEQAAKELAASASRPMVSADPVARGIHFQTTSQAMMADPRVARQDPNSVLHLETAVTTYSTGVGAGGKTGTGTSVLGTQSPSKERLARDAARQLAATRRTAPFTSFSGRTTYQSEMTKKEPVEELTADETKVRMHQDLMVDTMQHPIMNPKEKASAAVGGKAPLDFTIADPDAVLVDAVRRAILARGGSSALVHLARHFKIVDDSGDGNLDAAELAKALAEYGLDDDSVGDLMRIVDRDASGTVNYNEFLRMVRGPMNEKRRKAVQLCFDKLDADMNGVLDITDIRKFYDAKQHPKVLSGEKTEDEVLLAFLDKFDTVTKDGKVTPAEFAEYYENVSCSYDNDDHFIEMLRAAWKLNHKLVKRVNY